MSERNYITAENIIVGFGEQEVLHFDSLRIHEGEKIGLVGANGAGKTTLLRLIAGELAPDKGRVARNCELLFFKQFGEEETGTPGTDADGRHLSLLGVRDRAFREHVSGGEETRLRLAKVFSAERPLLMLDEPTSHLDSEGIKLLTEKLLRVPTLLLISHNRALMNAVCTRIIAIEDGALKSVDGNYDDYLRLKEAATERAWAEYEQYSTEMKRLKSAYREKKDQARRMEKKPRHLSSSEAKAIAFASKRKPEDKARSKEKAARNILMRMEHMEVKEKPKEEARIRPDFRLTDPPENRIVISAEHLSFAYPDGTEIFQDASFQIGRGERVAITGKNGAGKTTLLHLIRDREGVYVVPKAKIGYIEQNLSQLDPAKTVLENMMAHSIQREDIARMILSRMLLSARDMQKRVGVLSGGERIKLSFAMLFVSDINVIALDEPTNFLDLPSIEALENMFREYEGTMLFVSHDETFIRRIATRVLHVEDGRIRETAAI